MKLFAVYSCGGGWRCLEGIFTTEEKAESAIENIKNDAEYMEPGMAVWFEEEWTDPPELLYKARESCNRMDRRRTMGG